MGLTVKARCDNMAVVVATIKAGTCKESKAMHLMRCLAFIEATRSFTLVAEHIRGVDNVVADALSRDRCERARSMQVSDENTTTIPDEMVAILTEEYPC